MKIVIKHIVSTVVSFGEIVIEVLQGRIKRHTYRIIDIVEVNDEYEILVQVAHSRHVFRMTPGEILEHDSLTDFFSQRDIRILTYLGYLKLHSPKYSIISKNVSDSKFSFTIKERGKKKAVIKSAAELSSNEFIISRMGQMDVLSIGYAVASESIVSEHEQKKELLIQDKNNLKN